MSLVEPRHKKTCLGGFRPGRTQTGVYSHRRWLEACNLESRGIVLSVAKTKALVYSLHMQK